jgi:uncharacterized protein
MSQDTLIDTGFLLAYFHRKDRHYTRAIETIRSLKGARIVPSPVLVEAFYMLFSRMNYESAIRGFEEIQKTTGFQIVDLNPQDMRRMAEIMRDYVDNEFDYVDTAIMALSERLNISTICTIDSTDFHIFRPTHTEYFTILP